MKAELPPDTKKHLDGIIEKLLAILQTARDNTSARSEYMDYDGSMGGQVLESNPPIEHSYKDLSEAYVKLFAQAKKDGVNLRHLETQFEREKAKDPWTHKTRWITKEEFKAFTQEIAPIVEEIRVQLRKIGGATAPDWYSASFDALPTKTRVLVLHGDRVKKPSEPTPELIQLAQRVSDVAASRGLVSNGGQWEVDAEADDAEGEIDSAVAVNSAWPAAS
jgi:hypothetical protein